MKFLFFFWLLLCLALFFPMVVYAEVVINEVHPIPTEGSEWIELFNTATQSASLQGWSLEDQLSSPSVLKLFSEVATISAQGFLVVEVNNKLNNTGDGVVLKNSVGEVTDIMSYSSAQVGQSWSRSPNGSGAFVIQAPTKGSHNLDPIPSPSPSPLPSPSPSPLVTPSLIPTPLPTPTILPSPSPSPSPLPSPLPQPTNLQLSEVMACPETGESEWVEIYNPDSMFYILSNWQIKDALGNTRVFSTTISSQSYAVVSLSSGIINNDGDVIHLERADGVRLALAQLPACHKGKSFIFQDNVWRESSAPTKGAANIISTETVITDMGEEEQDLNSLEEFVLPVATKSAFMSPGKKTLPTGLFTATQSASLSGIILGADTFATPSAQFVDEPLPFWYHKYFILALSLLGLTCIGSGSFYFIQWYTEQYAKHDLEVV